MKEQLIISSSEEFIAANFNAYKEVIISEGVELQFRNKEILRLNFETSTSLYTDRNHRTSYLHPGLCYPAMFVDEAAKRIKDLKGYVKEGGQAIFYYSDMNLPLLCSLLTLAYQNCECSTKDYIGYTNIPFPYKRSNFSPGWIWSCCWYDHQKDFIEGKNELNEFWDNTSLTFPRFHSRDFPVFNEGRIEDEEGVVGFSVLLGTGKITVLPTQTANSDDVVITVNDFPSEYIAGSHQKARLSCSIFKDDYEANVFHFLKFMTLYYYSNTNQGIAFEVDRDNYLIDLKVYTGDYLIDMPYDFMFMEKDGSNPSNFLTHLQRIIEPVLIPKGCLDSEKLLMKSTVLYREDNQRKNIQGHSSYLQEKLINLKIVFSDEAKENIQSLSMKNLTDDVIMADLNNNLGNLISEIIL